MAVSLTYIYSIASAYLLQSTPHGGQVLSLSCAIRWRTILDRLGCSPFCWRGTAQIGRTRWEIRSDNRYRVHATDVLHFPNPGNY